MLPDISVKRQSRQARPFHEFAQSDLKSGCYQTLHEFKSDLKSGGLIDRITHKSIEEWVIHDWARLCPQRVWRPRS